MKTSDFDYPLPRELIAQTPIEPRDHSRLMVVSRSDGSIQHRHFYNLPQYLREGDLLIFNDTRVIPARLYGVRTPTGGKVEVLLLQRLSPGVWRSLVRPGRRMGPGVAFEVRGNGASVQGQVLDVEEGGTRLVQFSSDPDMSGLERVGVVPLPPYIHEPLKDPERYQTIYARNDGSVAAPTAGLHFTLRLMEVLQESGIGFAFVTLHVGLDTFRPVKEEEPENHKLHTEYWELCQDAADAINAAKGEGRRVIAVGTTSVRLLEQAARLSGGGDLKPSSGWADLFILPGYRFQVVDAMITNFHLPRSTLLMLVCAFGGRDMVLRAYREAITHRYRFYSFGDCMLIV